MPRYTLRTLLIAVTLACVILAWAAYVRQMERFHRSEERKNVGNLAASDSVFWPASENPQAERDEFVTAKIEDFVTQDAAFRSHP